MPGRHTIRSALPGLIAATAVLAAALVLAVLVGRIR